MAAWPHIRRVLGYDDNDSTAADDVAPRSVSSSPDELAPVDSAVPSRDIIEPHDLSEDPPSPRSGNSSQDNIRVESPVNRSQSPEQVTFWPALERYLDDPSLPRPELRCMICLELMPVLGVDRGGEEEASPGSEKCRVLLCGHLIGNRCFDEYISNHFERSQNQQDEQQEAGFTSAACPICRTSLGCRRCGLLYKSATLPALVGDEIVDVPPILVGSAEPPETCEDCIANLELEEAWLTYFQQLRLRQPSSAVQSGT